MFISLFLRTHKHCRAPNKVKVGYDNSVNFARYKTYSWQEAAMSPARRDGAVSAIDPELSSKGLWKAEKDGDLTLNSAGVPFAKPGAEPAYLSQMKEASARHPKTTIIWAHTGMGRVVRPVQGHAAVIEAILNDPHFNHVYFDISWDEVAKYLMATPESIKISADLIGR